MHQIKEIKGKMSQVTQIQTTTEAKKTLLTTPNSWKKRPKLTLSWSTTRNVTKKTSTMITISFPWLRSMI